MRIIHRLPILISLCFCSNPKQATGGTGSYVWTSSTRNVATVNVHGTVSTANQVGMTNVTAADNRNPAHYGLSKVIDSISYYQLALGFVQVSIHTLSHLENDRDVSAWFTLTSLLSRAVCNFCVFSRFQKAIPGLTHK